VWFEKEEREKIRKPKPATQPKPISHPAQRLKPAQQPTQPQTREQPNPRPLSCASPNSTSAQTGPGHFPLLSLPPTQHRGQLAPSPARPATALFSPRPRASDHPFHWTPPAGLSHAALSNPASTPHGPAGPTLRSAATRVAPQAFPPPG